ncbi:MAG TPA: DUF2568 domain-containing protein, partial [Phototrophicaceae bacterium]|nr:DUF2568 domain-containing protein [Phototrophicaceae bacterium]
RVPNDPGKALVQIPGPARLLLELTYYAGAAILCAAANQPTAAAIFAVVVAFHYLISYDHVRWLLKQ